MSKVLVKNLSLEAIGVVDLDSAVVPLDDFGVFVGQHLGQLYKVAKRWC
jgi:hypothetical protein